MMQKQQRLLGITASARTRGVSERSHISCCKARKHSIPAGTGFVVSMCCRACCLLSVFVPSMVVALLRCIPSVPSRRAAFEAQRDATCPDASLICSVAGKRPVMPWPAQRTCFSSRTFFTLGLIILWCCLCLLIQSADLKTNRASRSAGSHACY